MQTMLKKYTKIDVISNYVLFVFSCTVISYSVVLNPDTLPKNYVDFILRNSQIDREKAKLIKDVANGKMLTKSDMLNKDIEVVDKMNYMPWYSLYEFF